MSEPASTVMPARPLLSICIPTFNRSSFLRVMLEALLPQVADVGTRVEVWISDNASTDDTREVVQDCSTLGPVNYSRNESNLGPLGNIVNAATVLARGEFVWLLGDHNLLLPGGLANVVEKIKAHRDLDVFYVNFKCASYPQDWPATAIGGHTGTHSYLANADTADRDVKEWGELVQCGTSALCTQAYAHIVRKTLWSEFWSNRTLAEEYTSGETTYPHTWMIAETRFRDPSFYVGEPALTIFNGAQSWDDPRTRAKVSLRGLPALIELFAKRGMPAAKIVEARNFAGRLAYETTIGLCNSGAPGRMMLPLSLLGAGGAFQHPYLLRHIWRGYIDSKSTAAARFMSRTAQRFGRS